ncbi:TolC family protein [Mariprofundus ferrooxydans]|nr:TolC family protein [Mariprofundus ferrooxydans]
MFFWSNISINYNVLIKQVSVLLFVTVAASAGAAEITTLRDSVEYAVAHNRLLAADGSSIEQARAGQDMASGQFMPRIDLSTGVLRTDAPGDYFGIRLNQQRITAADFRPTLLNNPGYINNYQTRLNVRMPVYRGGALWAGKKKADHQAEAAVLSHDYMQQQVIYQAIAAYVQTRAAFAAIHAMQTAVNAAEKRYHDTQALQKRGVLINSDVMDARVHLLRSGLKLKQANNAYAQARDVLQRVLGLDGDTTLRADAEPNLVAREWVLDQAIEQALAERADLKALNEAYQASQAEVDASAAAFRPRVDLVAGQEWNASTPALKNRNSMVAATISMNLFAGGADRARTRASRAKLIGLELQLSDHKQQVRNEVKHAWRMLDESKARVISEGEALKQSEESLRIKSLRYAQGLSKTSDLLDAQLQVDTTRLSTIRANYDVTIARAALQLAVGMLNEDVIQ